MNNVLAESQVKNIDLKPCPFCGQDVKTWDNSNGTIINVIECPTCKVRFVFPCVLQAEKKYFDIWNTRTSQPDCINNEIFIKAENHITEIKNKSESCIYGLNLQQCRKGHYPLFDCSTCKDYKEKEGENK